MPSRDLIEGKSARQVWEATLGQLQIQVSKSNYQTWLEKTTAIRIEDNRLVVGVPNTFIAEYLEKNQRSLVEKILADICQQDIAVEFKVNGQVSSSYHVKTSPGQQPSLPLFNPRYTFNGFVVGPSNLLAYDAALKVAEDPGKYFNPLFIYGGAGTGKTHLLQAIGHEALAKDLRALYVTAEQYTNELVSAIRNRNTDNFYSRYRNLDILLVDDVQFFGGKEHTEESFFHTFNALHDSGHQIALTCNCPPKGIPELQDRLCSRFEWGLSTDIQPPDFDTRLAILRAKAEQEKANIPLDVLEVIALQVQQNIRALEGSLNRLIAYARLLRTPLTQELATRALKDISDTQTKLGPVTPNLIIEKVVNSFRVTPTDLKGRKRDEKTALARQVAMYLLRQETGCSLAAIGNELGGRSAATVSHAYQKIAADINNSPTLRRKVLDIQQGLHTTSPEKQ